MNKNKLRIVIADNSEPQELLKFLGNLFEVELLKPVKGEKLLYRPDLVIFTDGETINPESLGLKTIPQLNNFNHSRDTIEIDNYYNYVKGGTLRLGIGRGAQFLSHFIGARNIQYVEGHTEQHLIRIEGWGNYTVESNHIQMMYPYNLSEKSYDIIGYSKNFKSKTYLNTANKEIQIKPEFLEAEIVQYNNTLCFQFCPENTTGELKDACLSIIQRFINNNGKVQKSELEPEFEVERNTGSLGSISNRGIGISSHAMPKFSLQTLDYMDNLRVAAQESMQNTNNSVNEFNLSSNRKLSFGSGTYYKYNDPFAVAKEGGIKPEETLEENSAK